MSSKLYASVHNAWKDHMQCFFLLCPTTSHSGFWLSSYLLLQLNCSMALALILFKRSWKKYRRKHQSDCCIKMGHLWPLFCLFLAFSNKQYNFYHKSMWKNVHPVYGARIRTHNLWNMSLLPQSLDQGCRPLYNFLSLIMHQIRHELGLAWTTTAMKRAFRRHISYSQEVANCC